MGDQVMQHVEGFGRQGKGCVPRQRQALSGSRRKSAKRHWGEEDIHDLLFSHLGVGHNSEVSKRMIPQPPGAGMAKRSGRLPKYYSIFTRLLRHLYDIPPTPVLPPPRQAGRPRASPPWGGAPTRVRPVWNRFSLAPLRPDPREEGHQRPPPHHHHQHHYCLDEATVQGFKTSVHCGPLLRPGDVGYDEARTVWTHDRPQARAHPHA